VGAVLLALAAGASSATHASTGRTAKRYVTTDRAEVIELLHSRFHGARLVPSIKSSAAKMLQYCKQLC